MIFEFHKLDIDNYSKRELVQRTKLIIIIKGHIVFSPTPLFRAFKICDFEALNKEFSQK